MSELFKNIRKTIADAAQNKEQRVAELKAQGLNTAGGQSTAGKTFRQVQQKNANKMTEVRQKAQERQDKVTYTEIMRRGDASPARQKLLAQQEAASKWYQGDTPTSSEALARIYTIAQEDSARAEQLYNAYIGFTQDASTPFYNPYSTATNKASAALSELGYDMSGGITKEWLEENSYLKNYYRTSDTGTNPLSPTKSSSNEQDAAYWWYQAYKAEETTEQAETEWQALQEEIAYWTNRTDRNYTDDEILAKIDWSNYKTLVKMDEGKDSGVPLTLNRSVGYSQDALKGVIWAARNGSTGSTQNDSVKAVLGAGKSYTEMQPVRRKLDATSEYYSPYSVGCTMDDEALYFGVSRFGEDWLEENKSILNGTDATAKQMYQNVYAAEQTTLEAEAELKDLQAKVDNLLKYSSDPDKILAAVDGEYKTLEKLDESMQTGKLLDTTRRINYSKGDLERYVRNQCALANAAATGKEFASTVKKVLGVGASIVKATSLGDGRDNAINAAGTTIAEAGTDAEKTAFDTAYSADFGTYVDEVNGAITNGDVNGQEMYEYSQQRANKQAATEGLDAYATVKTYETAVTERDAAIKELEETYGIYVDEDGNIDTTRMQSTEPKTSGFVKDVNLNNAKAIAAGGGSDAGLGSNPFAVGGYDMSAGTLEIQKEKLAELQADLKSGKYRDYDDIERVNKEIYELQREIDQREAKQEEAQKGDAQEPTSKKKPSLQTRLTAVDLTEEQQKEVNKLLNTIDEANETINGTQEEYDKAQTTLKQIEDGYAAAAAIADMTGATKYDTSAMQIIESIAPIATEYVPTEWRSGNLFSLIMDYYGATYEETAAAAKKRVKANQAEIDAVNKAREELEKLGVDIGADLGVDYDNNLKRYVADLERDNKDAEYFLLGENEDFDEVAKEAADAIGADVDYAGTAKIWGRSVDAVVYYRLKDIEAGERNAEREKNGYSQQDQATLMTGGSLTEDEDRAVHFGNSSDWQDVSDGQFMNEQECKTYLYIRGTQGAQAAYEYFSYLTDDTYGQLTVRASEKYSEMAAEFAESNPVLSTAISVVSAPFAGVSSVFEAIHGSLFAEEINPYGQGYRAKDMSSTAVSTITQNIKEDTKQWALETLPNLEIGGIKINLSDEQVEKCADAISWLSGAVYQGTEQLAESTMYGITLGSLAGGISAKTATAFKALGMSEKGAGILGGMAHSFVTSGLGQGLAAGATETQEAKKKGATDAEAQLIGGVFVLAEAITETIELENLKDAFSLGGDALATGIKRLFNVGFSGLNEDVGETAAGLLESWSEHLVLGSKSDYDQKVKEYEEQGYRLDEARKMAKREVVLESLEEGAIAFISGEVGSISGQFAGRMNNQVDISERMRNLNDRVGLNTQTNVQPEQTNVQNQQTAQTQYRERSMQQPLTVQDETAQNAATIAQDGQSTETDNAVQESAETATNENTAEETQTYETVEQIDEAIAQKQTEVNKASRKVQSLERQLRNSRSSKTQQSLIDATSEMRRANLELEQLQQQRTEIEQRQASKPSIQTPLTVQDETTAQTESTAQESAQTEQPKRQMQERVTVQDAETTQAESNQTAAQETNQQKRQLQQPATMLDESRAKRTASEITTLQIAMTEADSSSMTATVGAILTEDAGNLTEKDAASAAAQNLVHRYGAKEVGNATLKMILYDNGDITGTKEALTVAGLYPNGKANGVLQEIMWNDVTAETVTQLREAAMEDLTQPDADAVISQNIHDSRVANDVVKQAGEGAFNGVQPYEDAVTKRKIERRQAENMLRQARQRLSDLRQNFVSIQQQFLNDPTNGSLMGAFASTLKDVEGQTKVVQEYEQSLTNAEQSLTEAQKQLDQKRDETVTNVRRQAEANIAEQDVQRTAEIAQRQAEEAARQQAEAQEKTGYQKKQFIPYDGPVPQNVGGTQQETVTIDDASYAQVQQIVEEAQAEAKDKANIKGIVRSALRALFGNRLDQAKVTLDNVQFDGQPYTVTLVKNMINKVVSDPGMTVEKLSVLSNIEQVVKNANYLTSSDVDRSKQKKDYVIRYDYLSSRTKINGQDYNAILTVEAYDYQNKMRTYRLENIEMTPVDSPSATGYVPALAGNDRNSLQYLLRTGPANSVASSDSILSDGSKNVNTENISNLESLNDANVPPATPTQDSAGTQNDSGDKNRQFGTQTAQSTDMLFEETRKYLLNNSVYEADSNTEQIDRAIAWVREQATMSDPTGYQNAKTAVTDPSFDYTTADGQAQMLVVMRLAGQMNDVSGQTQVADVFNRQGTTIAQALQARKIFYMMNPSAQIAAIQKIADNLSEENGVPVTIPEDALKRLGEAINPNDAQRIRNEIVNDLYKQLPANWKSRLNGIRYFAMLANPRTHIRNILGNTIMKGTAYARDEINAGLERFLPKEQRTKSFWVNSDYKDAAKSLYTEVSSMFDGSGGKYNPETNRRAFNTNWLQKLADFNTNLLDKEDTIAMKGNFIHYLGGFLQARGWDVNNLTDAQKQEAVQYAFTNAEKNVYHQASKFAEWLNKLGRGKDASIGTKVGRYMLEGVLPFKKTPINIFKTGIEYSPVGLISSLTHDLYQVNQYRKTGGKKGITTAQFLQNMSSGLTGCGLMGLGAFMMANGLLTVGFKDDDPEDEYSEMTGHQEFAIELFGYSYTIDWTAPASIPLFMGAALQKEIESREEGITWKNAFSVAMSALQSMAEPMLNLTMLDGINSVIQSISYGNITGTPAEDIAIQSLLNLTTQLVPTSLGAVARTIDPVRRKTYADKNSNLPTWLQYPIERVQNKLPGLSELNMPYLNAWGEEDREDSLATRIFENFVSPGYLSKIESDSVETELLSISTQTGSDLIPDLPEQSFSVDGVTVNLTSEEYEQYVKTRGSKMHDALEELFATDEYKAMSLTAQKDCIEDIQKWATEQGKAAVCPGKKLTGWKATDDPVSSVIELRASEDLQAYRDEAYANIKQAVENEDATTAADWVYGLKESGVESSTIKSKMTTAYKEEYQNAAREGDRATMSRIEAVLTALDVGYKQKDFSNWELDAFKE